VKYFEVLRQGQVQPRWEKKRVRQNKKKSRNRESFVSLPSIYPVINRRGKPGVITDSGDDRSFGGFRDVI
jgi:hypothetical protein